jgi:hypothetical protein
VGEGYHLGRTLTAEDVSAVSTVVLSVGEGEAFSAAHADIRVGPLGWLDVGVSSESRKGRGQNIQHCCRTWLQQPRSWEESGSLLSARSDMFRQCSQERSGQ